MAASASRWDEPAQVDTTKPNAARMYDWYLGGGHNFEVDREFGRRVEAIWPNIKPVARNNRAFLQRVVKDSLAAGVRQFLDVGSGVPTAGNVHEVSKQAQPPAHVSTSTTSRSRSPRARCCWRNSRPATAPR